jgi:hypothetical protein
MDYPGPGGTSGVCMPHFVLFYAAPIVYHLIDVSWARPIYTSENSLKSRPFASSSKYINPSETRLPFMDGDFKQSRFETIAKRFCSPAFAEFLDQPHACCKKWHELHKRWT